MHATMLIPMSVPKPDPEVMEHKTNSSYRKDSTKLVKRLHEIKDLQHAQHNQLIKHQETCTLNVPYMTITNLYQRFMFSLL
jgi:hypothetical protein